jgi:hypothetical protein
MSRVNVYLPDELAATMRAELPELNVSQLLQEALRDALRCEHHVVSCDRCAQPLDRMELRRETVQTFYDETLRQLTPLVHSRGTAEGAVRVLREVLVNLLDCYTPRRPGRLVRPARAPRRHPSSGRPLVAGETVGETDSTGLPDLRAQRRQSA